MISDLPSFPLSAGTQHWSVIEDQQPADKHREHSGTRRRARKMMMEKKTAPDLVIRGWHKLSLWSQIRKFALTPVMLRKISLQTTEAQLYLHHTVFSNKLGNDNQILAAPDHAKASVGRTQKIAQSVMQIAQQHPIPAPAGDQPTVAQYPLKRARGTTPPATRGPAQSMPNRFTEPRKIEQVHVAELPRTEIHC